MTEAEKNTLGRLLIAIEAKDRAVRAAAHAAYSRASVNALIQATTELDEAIAQARELMEPKTTPSTMLYVVQPRHGAQDTCTGPYWTLDSAKAAAFKSTFEHQMAATITRDGTPIVRVSPSGFCTYLGE